MNIGISDIKDTVALSAQMKVYGSQAYRDLVGIQEAVKACGSLIEYMPQLMQAATLSSAMIDASDLKDDEKASLKGNQQIALHAMVKVNRLLEEFSK